MAERKRRRPVQRTQAPGPILMLPNAELPADPRATLERALADVSRMFREQNFQSADEANAALEQLLGSGQLSISKLPSPEGERTPLEQAQEVMYQAWEADGRQRIQLARKALAVSADCADAYVLLAEESAKSPQEARTLYEQAVAAGERALGPKGFEEFDGMFWGVVETRPYMRAREGLAALLWLLGDRPQAMRHYAEMLKLNPNDNQGIRYVLLNSLLIAGSNDDVEALLEEYPDDFSVAWHYARALLAYRREGVSAGANRLLKQAIQTNHFVPDYLLGLKLPPETEPEFFTPGDESEAVQYILDSIVVWLMSPDAVAWLAEQIAKQPGKRPKLKR